MRKRRSPEQVERDKELGIKPCYGCDQTLSLECFPRNSSMRDGRYSLCRDCGTMRQRQNRLGMKIDQSLLLALVEKQEGKCAICGRRWEVVDHDHATGIVRGLLCQRCNKGIGALGDTSERLAAALDYLVTTEKE